MKIKKGANLFWGGVNNIEGLQEIEMDEVVGIRMASDKRVVGVAAMAMSTMEIQEAEEITGTAAYNLHHVDDQLYEIGQKVLGPVKFDFYMDEKVAANNDDEEEDDDGGDKKKKKKKDGKEKKDKKKKKGQEYEEEEEVDMGAFLAFNKKTESNAPAWDKKAPKMSKVLGLDEKKNRPQAGDGKKKGGKGKRKESGEFMEEKGGEQEPVEEDNIPIQTKKGKKGKKGKGKKKDIESEESEAEEIVENARKESQDNVEGETEGPKGPTPKEMDSYIKEAFMNCLKLS